MPELKPESTLPMTRLTPEQRAARYEQLRRRTALSRIFARHRNPDLYVRWVRDDKHDVSLHKHYGFEFAKDDPRKPEAQRQIETVVEISSDGFYRTGDVILMVCYRDDYEFFINEGVSRSKELLNAGKKNFRTEAEKLEIPVFERDKNGKVIS